MNTLEDIGVISTLQDLNIDFDMLDANENDFVSTTDLIVLK